MAEIGSTLREARMRAHIDISEVEASTKIRAKYLRAIENEEWDLLPGAVYVKSFLRTYADYLGLDSRLLIDEFKRRYERPADHELRPISGITRDRDRSPRERSSRRRPSASPSFSISPRLVIGAALLVIVAALYVLGSSSNSGNTTGNDGIVSPNSGHHKKSTTAGHGHGAKTKTDTNTNTTVTRPATTVVPKATLALVATGTIWVCVEGPNHKLLIPGLDYVAGGEKIKTVSAKKLWVDLGNADATATVNGKPYTLPASSATGIGLVISPTGVKADPSPPKCNA